jgi:hypothetical protein
MGNLWGFMRHESHRHRNINAVFRRKPSDVSGPVLFDTSILAQIRFGRQKKESNGKKSDQGHQK